MLRVTERGLEVRASAKVCKAMDEVRFAIEWLERSKVEGVY